MISVELKVNDTVVGTLGIEHARTCRSCTDPDHLGSRHRYLVQIHELSNGSTRTMVWSDWVSHDPAQGAWALVQDALNRYPKAAWR